MPDVIVVHKDVWKHVVSSVFSVCEIHPALSCFALVIFFLTHLYRTLEDDVNEDVMLGHNVG